MKKLLSKKKNEKTAWDSLNGRQKLRQIWDYYKLPIAVACILLYIVGYRVYRNVTYHEPALYAGFINFAPGEKMKETLSKALPQEEIKLYEGLYLTDDTTSEHFQYAYASQLKILAAIDAQQLDIVLLDKDAFDAFSQNGYLYDLEEFLSENDTGTDSSVLPGDLLQPYLVENLEILEDNADELAFDDSIPYESQTRTYSMGIDLSLGSPLFQNASLSGRVYLGILANTPRKEAVAEYLRYLFTETESSPNT